MKVHKLCVGIVLQIQDCEGGVVLHAGLYCVVVNKVCGTFQAKILA